MEARQSNAETKTMKYKIVVTNDEGATSEHFKKTERGLELLLSGCRAHGYKYSVSLVSK